MRAATPLRMATAMSSSPQRAAQPLDEPLRGRMRPLVLIVDDEPGIVDFLRFALDDHGYRVVTARDGALALCEVRRERPDFVLTDLMMPRVDGWELSAALRNDASLRDVPIIGMSAVDPRGAPFDAFLRKPFELDTLLDALDRLSAEGADGLAGSSVSSSISMQR